MEPGHLRSVKLEPDPEGSSPAALCEAVVVKEEAEEVHNEDDTSNESIPRQMKLEPETVISEDSSSFQFATVQKEELDIEDDDDDYLLDEEDCATSSSEGHDSDEEGFESHAEFILHQRRRKQAVLNKPEREPDQTKPPPSNGKFFTCRECNAMFTSKKDFRFHWRKHQQQRILAAGHFKCPLCDKAFKKPADLERHSAKETGTCPKLRAKFICDDCGKIFFSPIRFQKHLLRHQNVKAKLAQKPPKKPKRTIWECEECGKTFPFQNYFHKHQLMHDAIRNEKYKCDLCQKLFAQKKGLERHVQYVHDKIPQKKDPKPDLPREPVDCPVCSKTVYKDGLKTHLRYHNYLATGRYKCDLCCKAFHNKVSLVDHQHRKICQQPGTVVTLHDDYKVFTCTECDKSFAKRTYLNTHIKRIHETKKQGLFRCETCKQSFGSKSHLSTHELTHAPREQRTTPKASRRKENPPEGPLNLVCAECGKGGFPTRKSVITHLKRVHENKSKSKYRCEVCQRVFGSRSNLLAHEQTHDPQQAERRTTKKKKPPEEGDACPDCGKWLPNRKSLLTHTKRVHENKRNGTFQCQTCGKVFGCRANLMSHERNHKREGKGEDGVSNDLTGA